MKKTDSNLTLPENGDRIAVIGRTGSGKTVFSVWLLSKMDFDTRPWIVLDYKGDPLINSITKAKRMSIDDPLPKQPGIYIIRVMPEDNEALSNLFFRIWERENVGVFLDETSLIPKNDRYFNGCLTQGRSKNITMILLMQRPVNISRYALSEASYFAVFDLTDDRDYDILNGYIKYGVPQEPPDYHNYYYSVKKKHGRVMGAVKSESEILADIDAKMPRQSFSTL